MKKRTNKRHKCEASVICSFFNKDQPVDATMLNCGSGGMYFESDSLFKEGTNIFFKVKTCFFDASTPELCSGLRTASLAQVRWWKKMGDKDAFRFGIGVKYY
jgi:hypothetical protein